MGVYLNGKKIEQPYLNGKKMNAYLNGFKVWKGNAKFKFNRVYQTVQDSDVMLYKISARDASNSVRYDNIQSIVAPPNNGYSGRLLDIRTGKAYNYNDLATSLPLWQELIGGRFFHVGYKLPNFEKIYSIPDPDNVGEILLELEDGTSFPISDINDMNKCYILTAEYYYNVSTTRTSSLSFADETCNLLTVFRSTSNSTTVALSRRNLPIGAFTGPYNPRYGTENAPIIPAGKGFTTIYHEPYVYTSTEETEITGDIFKPETWGLTNPVSSSSYNSRFIRIIRSPYMDPTYASGNHYRLHQYLGEIEGLVSQ